MRVDIKGRVGNASLPYRQGLMALFEAVINSIESIEESGREDGNITITVHRQDTLFSESDKSLSPISGFEVIDNGIGFNSKNYDSFNTSDSTLKRKIGGKGVGRFFWLKVFKSVEIKSVFVEDDEKMMRSFEFVLDDIDPIQSHELSPAGEQDEIRTIIRLNNINENYRKHIPTKLESIAYRLVEHFLAYYVLDILPKMILTDGDDDYNILSMCKNFVSQNEETVFEIDEYEFRVLHFLLRARAGMNHQINYCAARRVVNPTHLTSSNIPHLPKRIYGDNEPEDSFVYMAYILSPFLDEHVNLQRTGFNVYSEGQLTFLGEIAWPDVTNAAIQEADRFLSDITEPTKEKTAQQVREFVMEEAPQYRYLINNHPEVIDSIEPDSPPDKIEHQLYKAKREVEVLLNEEIDQIINATNDELLDPEDEINQKYNDRLLEINELGKAELAQYILHRRKVLALLERFMQIDDDGGYVREKTIHNLIFPMNSTSDAVPYDKQNLWIIDEKLSFHEYLSSDLQFRKIEPTESDSLGRPDLLIFDLPIAIVEDEPAKGVTIFEFKRPMKEHGNPVSQMYDYVRELRSNKAKDRNGRYVDIPNGTPFYCYAICDLSPRLRREFSNLGMQITPDSSGFFTYNPTSELNTYVEVISYSKLLKDAMQRNRILFDKLRITN